MFVPLDIYCFDSVSPILNRAVEGSISFNDLMEVLWANPHAVKHVEAATEARFQDGLAMFNVVADQFVAGDFTLHNAPPGFFELQSVLISLHQLSLDYHIIGRLKRTEAIVETDVEGLMRVKTILEKSILHFSDQTTRCEHPNPHLES